MPKNNYPTAKAAANGCFLVHRVLVGGWTTTDFVPKERGNKSARRCCNTHTHTHNIVHDPTVRVWKPIVAVGGVTQLLLWD